MDTQQDDALPAVTPTKHFSRRQITRWLALVLVIVLLSLSSARLVFFLRETIFFDRLIYGKDTRYGYLFPTWDTKDTSRPNDMAFLLASTNPQVLGTQDEKEVFSIWFFGDSWTFGMGVADAEVYPKLLEKKLSQNFPDAQIKIYNVAYAGDNLFNHYLKLNNVKEFAPDVDLRIVQLLDNDFVFNEMNTGFILNQKKSNYEHFLSIPPAQEILTNKCKNKPAYYAIQTKVELEAVGTKAEEVERNIHEKSFDPESANVCFFSELLDRFDKEVIFFYPQFNYWNEHSHVLISLIRDRHFRVLSLLGQQDTFQLNFKDSFHQYFHPPKEKTQISFRENHPNSSYHQYMADQLYNYILTTPEWQQFISQSYK